jgi:hypothetical protein
MNKKEKACDKDYITFCMKANNNFRAEFNMATYELFKEKLFTTIDSMSSDQSTLLKYIKRFIPVPLARSDEVEL